MDERLGPKYVCFFFSFSTPGALFFFFFHDNIFTFLKSFSGIFLKDFICFCCSLAETILNQSKQINMLVFNQKNISNKQIIDFNRLIHFVIAYTTTVTFWCNKRSCIRFGPSYVYFVIFVFPYRWSVQIASTSV